MKRKAVSARADQAMGIDEALRLREVGDPQLSPDATAVVYLVNALDEEAREYRRHRRDCLERIVAWLDRWVKPARARGWR